MPRRLLSERPREKRIVLVEASLGGARGNTRVLADRAAAALKGHGVERVVLASRPGFAAHRTKLARADALVFLTGTYWDGWSSHLQRFLEEATPTESTALWLGKPAAVLVTEHSVGGKGVVSRLQGVLATLGCLIPPQSGVVISRASITGRRSADAFGLPDVDHACANLLAALGTGTYAAWPVDRGDPRARWLRG